MKTSKLTTRLQARIPEEVRSFLSLQKGDRVVFEIEGGKVVLRKSIPLDVRYLEALDFTLSEWSSENDENAYKDL